MNSTSSLVLLFLLTQMNDSRHVAHPLGVGLPKNESRPDGDVLGSLDKPEFDDGSFSSLQNFRRVNPFYDDGLTNISYVDGRLEVLSDSVGVEEHIDFRFEAEAGSRKRSC